MRTRDQLLALLASLGMCGATSAASGVTIYGIADAGPGHTRYSFDQGGTHASHSTNGLRSGYRDKSRFGLRGSEDLGGGLSAMFRLEQGIDLADGSTKNGFDRLAFVGLSSDSWGTFTMGRQKDIADTFSDVDMVKSLGKAEHTLGGQGGRRDSLFKYVSPSFSGAQVGLAYARDADGATTDHFYSAGLRYKSGPLRLTAVYGHEKEQAKSYAVTNWMLAGTYDFKVVKLAAAWGQDRNGKFNKPGDVGKSTLDGFAPSGLGNYNQQGFKSNNYYLGAEIPTGPGVLGLMWGHSRSNLNRIDGSFQAGAQDIYGAMYNHSLSKRTRLYVYGTFARNLAYVRGFKGREAGLGINHKF